MSFLVQISLQNIHFRSLACTCLSRKRLQTWWEDRAPNLWWQARLCGVGSPWWWGGNPPFYAECKCSASWGSQKKGCCCCGCDWHGQMQLKKVKVGAEVAPLSSISSLKPLPTVSDRILQDKTDLLIFREEIVACLEIWIIYQKLTDVTTVV